MSQDFEQEFNDVQTATAAILYYLYRLAGCPFGDNWSGYEMWIQTSIRQPFNDLAERSDTDNSQDIE